jgi:hypothetical protein
MEHKFYTTLDAIASAVRSSYANKRYRAVDFFGKVIASAIGAGVLYVPLVQPRVINVGISEKFFVLRYANKVRLNSYHSSVTASIVFLTLHLPQDACTVIDIKRIIEQPYTTTELTTIIGQVMVFVLSLPYVGTPSVPVQQLQSWVKHSASG